MVTRAQKIIVDEVRSITPVTVPVPSLRLTPSDGEQVEPPECNENQRASRQTQQQHNCFQHDRFVSAVPGGPTCIGPRTLDPPIATTTRTYGRFVAITRCTTCTERRAD